MSRDFVMAVVADAGVFADVVGSGDLIVVDMRGIVGIATGVIAGDDEGEECDDWERSLAMVHFDNLQVVQIPMVVLVSSACRHHHSSCREEPCRCPFLEFRLLVR